MKHLVNIVVVLLSILGISLGSCRKNFDFQVSPGSLSFSKDTIFLDTVFANIASSTYALTVYNNDDDDVTIPEIRLRNADSNYRLNVDGLPGDSFTNIPLLANDSLFVFVETVTPQNTISQLEFLNVDAIQFVGSERTQEVELVTLVKDAVFLYPQETDTGMTETLPLGFDEQGNEVRIDGFFLENEELNFTNEKPYVIYGYAAVPQGQTLTIEAGARVHFHKNSGVIISNGASLHVKGQLSEDQVSLENEVIFEGDRLEPAFENVPGQWGTIWFFPESTNNVLEHLTIKNASIGLLCEGVENQNTTHYDLRQVQVQNSSAINLWARTASLTAVNSVFGNSGQISVYCNLGGNYDFKHCTIANYWTSSFRPAPALVIDNFIELSENTFFEADLVQANFANCIVDGNKALELGLLNTGNKAFNFNFKNCLIQFDDRNSDFEENALFDFTNTTFYEQVALNTELGFLNALDNDFRIGANSSAIGFGDANTSLSVPFDLLGFSRANLSDVGAYNETQE